MASALFFYERGRELTEKTQYIHVKNLEKYHPGYKDRSLIWCKVYFNMTNSDPEFEMLCEIDKWRFIAFIILELQSKKPIPIEEEYLKRKGFDLKKRPIRLTLQMLHNFANLVTEDLKPCSVDIYKEEYIKKSREEVYKEEKKNISLEIENLLKLFPQVIHKDIKTYWDRAAKKNKSNLITDGRKLTMLNELHNSYQRCNDESLFRDALEAAIIHDAPCIGYVDKVWADKKTKRPL